MKFMNWLRHFIMEVYNLITDVLVPLVEIVTVIAVILPFVPMKFIVMLKIAEEFLKNVGATKQDVANKFKRR